MSESDALESQLREAFESEYGAAEAVASEAAANVVSLGEEFDAEVTTDDVLTELEAAPYETFEHRFDAAVGELAAAIEDCTDSRAYRLAGYDELAADPSIGA